VLSAASADGNTPSGRLYRPPARGAYWLVALALRVLVRCYLRIRLEGGERLPAGPAILCFNHQSWADPFLLVAALPARPNLVFFGPREGDMSKGFRNRLITWSGRGIPFRPDGTGLVGVTHQVRAALWTGARIAIAPEGRIHAGERVLLPLDEGAARFALVAGVPLVPVAITGAGWLRLGRRVRIRIGTPIAATDRPGRQVARVLTEDLRRALLELVADARDEPPPGPLGRRLTELFNDWPEGVRPAPPAEPDGPPRFCDTPGDEHQQTRKE
jgi:1-acyl-sn-glycerol-3-phosphate acyltransferase